MPGYVSFPPESRAALLRGVNMMGNLLGLTLGPVGQSVALTRISTPKATPELLPDAGTIARRIIELPQPLESMGALLIRQLACKMYDEVGDGAATAVVIAQAALREAERHVAAGWNPMQLRQGMELALEVITTELKSISTPLDTPESIIGMVQAATGHPALAKVIAEAVDVVGPDGTIVIEESQGTKIEREYQEGVRWDSGWVSSAFATDTDRNEAVLINPLVLLTDNEITSAAELLPLLEQLMAAGERALAIVSNGMRTPAIALLLANKEKEMLAPLAINAPFYGDQKRAVLEDIAILTGGQVISDVLGRSLADTKLGDLGRARRVWANQRAFSIVGGKGRPAAVRERIRLLRTWLPSADSDDERNKMRQRIGKLKGGAAYLRIGAHSATEQAELRQRAEGAVRAVQASVEEGVVPGGGTGYLACIPALQKLARNGAEGAGIRIIQRAIEEPARRIVANAGMEPEPAIARLREQPPGWGYDVMSGRLIDMRAAGIVDAHKIARWALAAGVSAATAILTTDVLVHQAKPPLARNP